MVLNNAMNGTSFLFLLVFMAIGYVIHPMILPQLQKSGLVAKPKVVDSDADKVEAKIEKPAEVAKLDPKKPVAPVAVAPKVEPKPEPIVKDAAPIDPSTPLTDGEFLDVMQSAVKYGSVKEFTFSQAVDWRRLGQQEIGGETYDVGLVVYNASTVFGVQKIEAKALIQKRKIVKWLWAETNTLMQ